MKCRHFADTVIAEDPDVLLLQEVRMDTSFVRESPSKADGGNQVQHLLWHLNQAQRRSRSQNQAAGDTSSNNHAPELLRRSADRYHLVFQPAMNMINRFTQISFSRLYILDVPILSNRNQFSHRNEEGIAIFSRYPIIEAEVVLLPRELTDSSYVDDCCSCWKKVAVIFVGLLCRDDHQRAVLRVRIQIRDETKDTSVEVDLFTTHLRFARQCPKILQSCPLIHAITFGYCSLSNTAREKSALAIRKIVSKAKTETTARFTTSTTEDLAAVGAHMHTNADVVDEESAAVVEGSSEVSVVDVNVDGTTTVIAEPAVTHELTREHQQVRTGSCHRSRNLVQVCVIAVNYT
jgi:hypothetical protein